eukprot:TRINITY_DN9532_c0_g1_i2.p1 TRINITY_DN9532_c0_g1~~TRINITY_DN9532_c0_g1_i2.p1  ORF type:complete len:276 (-),score=48.86 TRINITY_DN9532_c0_g1_i2:744-1571(-)
MMLLFFLFLSCHIQESLCYENCGCIELPENLDSHKPESGGWAVVELVPEVGPHLGTLVPKSSDQAFFQFIDSAHSNADAPALDSLNCTQECTVLDSDWFMVTEGVCVCGRKESIILCEEEIGPVINVQCINNNEEETFTNTRSEKEDTTSSDWFPTTTATGTEAGTAAKETEKSSHNPNDKTGRLHLENHNFTSFIHSHFKSIQHENTTQVHYVGDKTDNKGNKVLALILGICALVCLFLAGVRVFIQMRRVRAKERKKKCIQQSILSDKIVTKL